MATNEKFCLKWNDFEHNVSSAFNTIREEKDFFDVTLVCDNSQVEAHKVIIAACSPFFRSILRRNPHQHPLLYLKGVLYDDLVSVLQFMYKGEVNIAQEQLNSFLAVAEDLQVKGLTQDSQNGGAKSQASKSSKPFLPQSSQSSSTPQIKRQKVLSSTAASASSFVDTGDDDIQEVVPVKTEPPAHHQTDPHQPHGVLAPMADESYVEEGYEGYSEGQQYEDYSNMGDGTELSKGYADANSKLDEIINANLYNDSGIFSCGLCGYSSRNSANVKTHIEAKHVSDADKQMPCEVCHYICPSRSAHRMHMKKHQ